MDLGFPRLTPDHPDVTPVPLDYRQLLAGLAAVQAASPTAAAGTHSADAMFDAADPVAALVELLRGGPDWDAAARALENAFHPGVARENRGFPP